MRLERLTLAPYGRFADREWRFRPDAALHVVVGANESGKTTTLAAIGDLLFGFPAQTPYAFAHDMRLLRVGGLFRLADGSALELRRRKGNKSTLVDALEQPVFEAALQSALGAVDRKTFETEFGLTSQALREGGRALLQAGGGLAQTLAASSAGLSALSLLRERLSQEAEALFTPRKSGSKAFYLALDRHGEAEKRFRDAVVTSDALKDADETVLRARAQASGLEAEHGETGQALARLQRAQRTSAKLARLHQLAEEIASFADLPDASERWLGETRAALTEDAKLAADLQRLTTEDSRDEAEVGALAVDEALLAHGAAIDSLRERLGAVRKAEEDLPRRVEAHNAAEAALDELARRLGLAGHEALLAATPGDPALARARALIEARRRAEEAHRAALDARDRAVSDRERLRVASGAEAIDPEPLRRRLGSLSETPAEADRLRRERAAWNSAMNALREEAARLDPPVGALDALVRLPLPDQASLAALARDAETLAGTRRETAARLASAVRAVDLSEAKLNKLRRDGAGATRADMLAARARREAGFETLDKAIDGEPGPRRQSFQAVRSLTLAADALADAVLADSERAARLEAAQEDLAARQQDRVEAEAELAALNRREAEAEAKGRELWSASGVASRTPAEMSRWRERVAALLARRQELADKDAELETLSRRVEAARAALAPVLAQMGAVGAHDLPVDAAFREANSRLEALQDAWTQSRKIEVEKVRAERDTGEAEARLAREAAVREALASEWSDAMTAIGRPASDSLAAAQAALDVWAAVASPRQARAREARSIEGIEADAASFAEGVAAIVGAVAPALRDEAPKDALAKLVEALSGARRAADARDRLRQSIARRDAARHALQAQRHALATGLREAQIRLAAADRDALAATLDRLERRQALESERRAASRDLAEIADGLDEPALRAEQADLDMTALPGRIELAQQRQRQLLQEIGEAAGALREAERRRDALALGRDAAGAARDKAEASAELLDIAERWITRQAAARLATRAIERHRAAAQDPLIARAGEMFALATDEAFLGLGTAWDDSDRPVLVALRAGGGQVRVEGLSEGARDQLFLALRLALLERRAGEPLPFVGDDLLASFDDARTARTLALLAEFGKRRQVLLFTHHRHVADLARTANDPAIEVLDM